MACFLSSSCLACFFFSSSAACFLASSSSYSRAFLLASSSNALVLSSSARASLFACSSKAFFLISSAKASFLASSSFSFFFASSPRFCFSKISCSTCLVSSSAEESFSSFCSGFDTMILSEDVIFLSVVFIGSPGFVSCSDVIGEASLPGTFESTLLLESDCSGVFKGGSGLGGVGCAGFGGVLVVFGVAPMCSSKCSQYTRLSRLMLQYGQTVNLDS